MITEQIASIKPVVANGKELVLVTTVSSKQVWVNKSQLDANAETITYNAHAEGSEWVNPKTGAKGIRKSALNEFVGCGKTSKFAVLDYLQAKGITPTFSLS